MLITSVSMYETQNYVNLEMSNVALGIWQCDTKLKWT